MTTNPTQGVIAEAWEHYKAHWQHLVGISLLIFIIVAAISLLLVLAFDWVGIILAIPISVIGSSLVQGALVKAFDDIKDGRADMSFGATVAAARPFIGRIIGASLLAGLGIGLGFLLLIVPGLILLTWWALIVPVIVYENSGAVEALGRSKRLVSGWGWQVFGVIVLMYLVLIGFGIVFTTLLVPLPDNVADFLGDVLGGALVTPFLALVAIILYTRLSGLNAPPTAAPPVTDPTAAPTSPPPGGTAPGGTPPGATPPGGTPPGATPPGA